MTRTRWTTCLAAVILTIPHPANAQRGQEDLADSLPPAGYGTLRQNDVAVRLETRNVEFRVLPLNEWVIRLLAPDSYHALHQVRQSWGDQVEREAGAWGITEPSTFLVTAFGLELESEFDPEGLTITSRNRLFRPIAIIPLTPEWGQQRLRRREAANALYVFEGGIEPREPMTVEYSGRRSDAWNRVLRLLELERVRVASRVKGSSE